MINRLKSVYALWAIPMGEPREHIRRLIQENCIRFDAAVFAPHMTVATFPGKTPLAEALSVAEEAAKLLPFRARIEGMGAGDSFTKAWYYLMEKNGELIRFAEKVHGLLPGAPVFDPDKWMPHISVVYKNLSDDQKAGLEMETPLAGNEIEFGEMRLLRTPYPIESLEQQLEWELYRLD